MIYPLVMRLRTKNLHAHDEMSYAHPEWGVPVT